MLLQDIYNVNQDSILYKESSYIKGIKQKIIQDFKLDPKIIKNNESIKFFDKKIFQNLSYKFDQKRTKILLEENSNNDFSSFLIKNGFIQKIENIDEKKIQVNSLDNDVKLFEEKFMKYQDLFQKDYLINLNSVLLNNCYNYQFKKNTSQKIFIRHNTDNIENTNYTRNFINIDENSKIILIEHFNNHVKSNENIVNFFEIKKNSELIHLIIQNNSFDSNLQFTTHANCYENSKYKQVIFNTSNSSLRNHHYANLLEKNSNADLKGIFFASNNQIIDNKTQINHLAELCQSNQKYKGILTDSAKASYLSKTHVDKIAQKTEAYQLSKGIILSDNAYFHSKPELKIFADDVKCSHGSTIGSFDKSILFYIKSRGIPENIAISLLIKSFYHDILVDQNDTIFLGIVYQSIQEWLEKNKYTDV